LADAELDESLFGLLDVDGEVGAAGARGTGTS
jgi:hypothetical protein